ncbi:hypothetical protein ABZ504_03040 [Streptomyces mirabilis]|uniref:hypothetical protein n=1 Tax=Streptomyces mirabilis TaxID=68239 RepID=UPI0033F18512
MTTALAVAAVLYVDLVNIRARYECFACDTKEGPVYGEDDVKAFAATVRNDHRARCTGGADQQGGHQ